MKQSDFFEMLQKTVSQYDTEITRGRCDIHSPPLNALARKAIGEVMKIPDGAESEINEMSQIVQSLQGQAIRPMRIFTLMTKAWEIYSKVVAPVEIQAAHDVLRQASVGREFFKGI
jgi:formiminotetrahydrofolate cyclodeaminase